RVNVPASVSPTKPSRPQPDSTRNAATSSEKFMRWLPWGVGAIMLVLYLVTLNRWVTFHGLSTTAKVLGWDWRPAIYNPLYYVATLPCRWLPTGWQLLGLNFFSALCASLSLAMLARSVCLLPHDR